MLEVKESRRDCLNRADENKKTRVLSKLSSNAAAWDTRLYACMCALELYL